MLAPPMIHTSSYFADSKCANKSGMEVNQCSPSWGSDLFAWVLARDERMRLALLRKGWRGMLSHVVRPMTTALFPAPVVRLAKWTMSALQCGQGRQPSYPIPPSEHMAAMSLNVSIDCGETRRTNYLWICICLCLKLFNDKIMTLYNINNYIIV